DRELAQMTDPAVSEIEMLKPSGVARARRANRHDRPLRLHGETYRERKSDKKPERAHRGEAEQNQEDLGVGQLPVLHGRGRVPDVVDVDREMDQKIGRASCRERRNIWEGVAMFKKMKSQGRLFYIKTEK